MIDAREEAAVDELPGEECSARIVVRCAMQELISFQYRLAKIIMRWGHDPAQNADLLKKGARGL